MLPRRSTPENAITRGAAGAGWPSLRPLNAVLRSGAAPSPRPTDEELLGLGIDLRSDQPASLRHALTPPRDLPDPRRTILPPPRIARRPPTMHAENAAGRPYGLWRASAS